MSLPASDALTNGSNIALTTYSSNWTLLLGALTVGPNGVFPASAATNCEALWNADVFPNDQFAQATIGAAANNAFTGVSVRASNTGTFTAYTFRVNPSLSQYQVNKFVSNANTPLSGTVSGTFVNGDVLKLQVVGSSLTAYQNGNVLYSTTDSSITGGSAGLAGFGSGAANGPAVKTWSAGAVIVSTPLFMYSVRNVLYFI